MRVKAAIFIALAVMLGLCTVQVYAQWAEPHSFYGDLTIDGSPAPIGTEVKAMGDNVEVGIAGNPITTTEAGKYGGPDIGEPKLIVQGDIQPLTPITFYVNGVDTGETYEYHSGETSKVDLSMEIAVGGEAYLVNKIGLLTPWVIILTLIVVAGVWLGMWNKRREPINRSAR
ncbi:hypothetical protein ACFLYG_02140 [Chloroflexota bacterium]